ncbi:Hypothetical predicted protein [Paramuricea clavata]|uniref:Uncharacterized protein n=1 Tax=Paramuricea clavata TaxID=317549 RepID=A0A6S7IX91_PARCT|nr:Hypothetical predicted protein [Paramuricea clavata]
MLDRSPLKEIYYVIYASMNPPYKVNEYGCVITRSRPVATKIWSMASDWKSHLTKERTAKKTVAEMTVHRLTSSKEVLSILHKLNNIISYSDVRLQNIAWARMVSANRRNLDLIDDEDEVKTVPEFYVGKLKGPPLFPDHSDNEEHDLLDECLKRDIVWSLPSAVSVNTNEETANNVGSWTPFNKEITVVQHGKALLEYLPVIPEAPDYKVCIDFVDYLCDLLKELEIGHIFAHTDQSHYLEITEGLRKRNNFNGRISPAKVLQGIICNDIRAGTIAFESSENAFNGGRYYRNMRLHKESFNAIVQFRAEKITSGFSEIDPNLKLKFQQLSSAPSPEAMEDVMVCPALKLLVQKIVQVEDGIESRMTTSYLRDVSSCTRVCS